MAEGGQRMGWSRLIYHGGFSIKGDGEDDCEGGQDGGGEDGGEGGHDGGGEDCGEICGDGNGEVPIPAHTNPYQTIPTPQVLLHSLFVK